MAAGCLSRNVRNVSRLSNRKRTFLLRRSRRLLRRPVQQASKEREVAATLRVDVSRIDKVMDLAGEIVLARNRLLNLAAKLESHYSGDQSVESLLETTSFLDRVTSDLQLPS